MAAHAWMAGNFVGAFLELEDDHPRRDRPTGDDQALVPRPDERGDLGGEAAELRVVQRVAAWGGKQAGAQLDNQS